MTALSSARKGGTHHSQLNLDDTRPEEIELTQCHMDGEDCQVPVDTHPTSVTAQG